MKRKNMSMFYLSAIVAITGAVGYQYFVKRVPETINPMVSMNYPAASGRGIALLK
jgi:hypothetical protein